MAPSNTLPPKTGREVSHATLSPKSNTEIFSHYMRRAQEEMKMSPDSKKKVEEHLMSCMVKIKDSSRNPAQTNDRKLGPSGLATFSPKQLPSNDSQTLGQQPQQRKSRQEPMKYQSLFHKVTEAVTLGRSLSQKMETPKEKRDTQSLKRNLLNDLIYKRKPPTVQAPKENILVVTN